MQRSGVRILVGDPGNCLGNKEKQPIAMGNPDLAFLAAPLSRPEWLLSSQWPPRKRPVTPRFEVSHSSSKAVEIE